ncbi:hypothetical protein X744_29545 [Mesorhizobium sp. LNJC372A00]|nr:hypothetical protein X745_28725 [Mesorhizobium sp. LNJC374B00]ESY52255.1 hypothetical protein X744_29545 [Mesorhizobium sp. LNJC372A00]
MAYLAEVIEINRGCQKFDDIEAVDSSSTVRFNAESVNVVRAFFGYDWEAMALDACEPVLGAGHEIC